MPCLQPWDGLALHVGHPAHLKPSQAAHCLDWAFSCLNLSQVLILQLIPLWQLGNCLASAMPGGSRAWQPVSLPGGPGSQAGSGWALGVQRVSVLTVEWLCGCLPQAPALGTPSCWGCIALGPDSVKSSWGSRPS